MASKTQYLIQKGLLTAPPKFLEFGVQYEVVMGSTAYGVAEDASDIDIYGFAIPPRDWVFPHLRGEIIGFDDCAPKFDQLQQHHMQDPSARAGKGAEYDLTIYSIVKFFRLLTDNNPNIIDALFVPRHCILHSTAIGELVRENRKLFLHKGCWARFKGYAYAQVHKMRTKKPEGGRQKIVDEFGYDVKFAYHVVRLLNEVEQILIEHDLDLAQNKEQLKAIRRGEWTQAQVEQYFTDKEKQLESVYVNSSLPAVANEAAIKQLLLQCLEQHYGSLHECVAKLGSAENALLEIEKIINREKMTIKGGS